MIGATGEPAFQNGCAPYEEGNPPTSVENYVEPPAFYKDKLGIVHLKGIVSWNDAEKSWDCPLHGSRFSADGDVIEGPSTRGLERQ